MCGIFGYSGHDKANVAKLKMLGMFNQTRGKDSCGYYFNEKLVKGTYLKKEWINFIESEIIDQRGKSNLFIGHTRYGTVGANTEENAHPFNINNKMILAHNGTISNIWEMCNYYEVDHKGIHVDSLALGHLIDKIGYSILEQYKGYAALLFTRLAEPDSLYVFHGASKVLDKDDKPTEERPLFYMKTNEGIYFSSMKNSLMAIRDNELQVPEIVEHNRLIKITKGKFAKSKMVIKREQTNVGLEKKNITAHAPQTVGSTSNTHTKNNHSNPYTQGMGTVTTPGTSVRDWKNILPSSNNGMGTANYPIPSLDEFKDPVDIWLETKPPRCFMGMPKEYDYLYYWKGRYWHMDTNEMANGVIFCDVSGVVYENKSSNKVHEHYFYRGVMLKDKQCWLDVSQHIEIADALGLTFIEPNKYNFAVCVSVYSKYPVTNLPTEALNVTLSVRKTWWKDNKSPNGGIRPVWGNRNYVYKLGQLIEIKREDKKDIILTPIDGTEWANYEVYSGGSKENEDVSSFNNGEIVVEGKDKHMNIKSLIQYFDKVYGSIDEVLSDCPSTVYIAIRLHVKDLLTTNNYRPEKDEIEEHICNFLTIAINDHVTFRDNMDDGYPSVEDYLHSAYIEEIAEGGDDDDDNTTDKKDFVKSLQDLVAHSQEVEDAEYEIMDDFKKKQTPQKASGEKSKEGLNSSTFSGMVKELPFQYPAPAKVINMPQPDKAQIQKIDEYLKSEEEFEKLHAYAAIKEADTLITYAKYLVNKSTRLKSLTRSKFATSLAPKLLVISQSIKDELQATADIYGIPQISDAAQAIKAKE